MHRDSKDSKLRWLWPVRFLEEVSGWRAMRAPRPRLFREVAIVLVPFGNLEAELMLPACGCEPGMSRARLVVQTDLAWTVQRGEALDP